jgi:aromatic ring-opening dioxygenase catalytic subunit (LigB family)
VACAGPPELAARVAALLGKAGLPSGLSANRGFDHGVFVPMKVAFPGAQIPVVTLSLAGSLDPALHLAAGRALAPLRDEGVLIVASGMSFHNLRGYFRPETTERARAFDAWLTKAVESAAPERNALLTAWREAPFAAYSHPREEHLIPLMVAAGAGGEAPGKRIFGDEPMGAAISAYRFDG